MKIRSLHFGEFVLAIGLLLASGILCLGLYTWVGDGPFYPLTKYSFQFGYDAWSPDGTKFVFMNLGTFERFYILELKTSNIQKIGWIGYGFSRTRMYAWSPDSSQLGYVENNDILVVDATGHNRRVLSEDCEGQCQFPAWSPDQTAIGVWTEPLGWCYWVDCRDPYALAVLDLETGVFTELTSDDRRTWYPLNPPDDVSRDAQGKYYYGLDAHIVDRQPSPDGKLAAVQHGQAIHIIDTANERVLYVLDGKTVYRLPFLGLTLQQTQWALIISAVLGIVLTTRLLFNPVVRPWMLTFVVFYLLIGGTSFFCTFVGPYLPD